MQNSENTHPASFGAYLHKKNSTLSDLYQQALAFKEIDQSLKKFLDPSLSSHFILASIKTEVAIILVNSPAWATRLRYNIPTILEALNNELNLKQIKTIRIKVQHSESKRSSTKNKPVFLSKDTAKLLQDSANSINDSELKNCLIKISKNCK